MTKYISIDLVFSEGRREMDIFRAACRYEAFRPRAFGSLGKRPGPTEGTREDVGFLAGWSLEPFISHFGSLLDGTSFQYAADSDANLAYLQSVARLRGPWPLQPFPNEESVEEYETTLLDCPLLSQHAMDEFDRCRKGWGQTTIDLYGTFSLCVRDPGRWNWENAYRMIYQQDPLEQFHMSFAFPLVLVQALVFPELPNETWVSLYSGSRVWLENQNAMRGHVGPAEANENLLRFAQLAGVMANNGQVPLRSAELTLEGSPFFEEGDRIMAALANVIPGIVYG